MKWIRPLALPLACLIALSSLACSRRQAQSEETTAGTVQTKNARSVSIVYPMTRAGNETASAYAYNVENLNLYELWNAADAVVRVRIGNWLTQTDYWTSGVSSIHWTYYEAQTLECYKGSSPGTFVLQQIGSASMSYQNLPLFTYGNELLLFLQKKTVDSSIKSEDDLLKIFSSSSLPISSSTVIVSPLNDRLYPYDEYYQIVDGGAIMDSVLMSDGEIYLLDRYDIALTTPGMTEVNLEGEVLEEVVSILSRRDPYAWALFRHDRFYSMSQLLERCHRANGD